MSINQRVAQLEKYYKSKGITFHKYINVNSQTIKNITGDRQSNPSHKILEAILKADPKINLRWLILGEGKMWQEGEFNRNQTEILTRVAELEKEVSNLKKMKQQIKEIAAEFRELNLESLKAMIEEMIKKEKEK